jgi:hypothetical protein
VQGTLSWRPVEKLSLTGGGGAEVTQMMGAQLVDPTYFASINYQPFKQTSMSLVASRSVSPALYQDVVTVSTSIGATFRQRFLEHYSFEVSGGYVTTPFVGFATPAEFTNNGQNGAPLLTGSVEQNRADYSRSARVSLSSTFRKHGTVSIFYSYNDITSSLSTFAMTSNQVGFEIGWGY